MINKKIGLIALLASFVAGDALAGTITNFASGDVLVCFRNGGAKDLVVDAGPVSTFTSATPNQRISITQYTVSQFDSAFGDANAVSWSAFTWLNDDTLFMSKARALLNKQTNPWQEYSADSQDNVALRMETIPPGANANLNYVPGVNTSTAVIEPDSDSGYKQGQGQSYQYALNGVTGGHFNNTFQGDPENTTPSDFSTSGTVVRSDFYQLTPISSGYGVGTLLGYFELATDGSMTYVAYPSATPVVQSISRAGSTTTINYTTGLYGTYTLRGTNTLSSGVAATNWPAITTLTSGDTSTHTYMDSDTSPNKFYIITAQ
jgi:hypothetical protein